MTHKALSWVCVFALIAVGVMAAPHRAAEGAWILHDNFNDPSLLVRQDRWNMGLSFTGSPGTTDVVRLIDGILGLGLPDNPRLLIGRRLGARAGATVGFDNVIYFTRSPNTNGIRADITMKACTVSDGLVQARVRGFFGEGSPTVDPNDLRNDVFVVLRVGCLTTNQPAITWFACQCVDGACNNCPTFNSGTFGPATLGQSRTLSIRRVGNNVELMADTAMQQFPLPGNATGIPNGAFLGISQRMDLFTPGNGGELIGVSCFDNVFLNDGL